MTLLFFVLIGLLFTLVIYKELETLLGNPGEHSEVNHGHSYECQMTSMKFSLFFLSEGVFSSLLIGDHRVT